PAPVRKRLADYAWPGNIRELENVTERIAVMIAGRKLDGAALLRDLQAAVPELFATPAGVPDAGEPVVGGPGGAPEVAAPAIADANRSLAGVARASQAAHIRRVLAECNGDRAAACHLLGISATTLWRRLKEADGR
ncbi:AAA-type ATPase lid domain-containing protein, partial [Cupriavidus plantarum]